MRANLFDGGNDVHAVRYRAEDNVSAVEPRGLDSADEELGAVGVWTSVGHGEGARAKVLELEVFVSKLFAVDGFTASASAVGEVTALEHELWDDSVELGALEAEWLSLLAHTLLAGAECTEVLDCLWNSSSLFIINMKNKG